MQIKRYKTRKRLKVTVVAEGTPQVTHGRSAVDKHEVAITFPQKHSTKASSLGASNVTEQYTLWMTLEEATALHNRLSSIISSQG